MNIEESSTKIGEILTRLMEEADLDDAKLARKTGIPASTISRLRNNPQANPTASSLRPLAAFFKLSISQLLGDEPIPVDRMPGHYDASANYTAARLPIIAWDQVYGWVNNDPAYKEKLFEWISTEKNVGEHSYALLVETNTLGLVFRKGALIIIDPKHNPVDGDYILVQASQDDKSVVVKQLITDGNDKYLKSVNPDIKGTKEWQSFNIYYGAIVEIRYSFQAAAVQKSRSAVSRPINATVGAVAR